MIDGFTIPPLHRAGWPFVAAASALWALLAWLLSTLGFFLGLIFVAWVAYFFRDPTRVTPTRSGLVISPADGKVIKVEPAVPPVELGMGETALTRISIFLNLFDVHVNRVPVEGTIVSTHYRPGAFVNASLDKASIDNERMAVRQKLADGREVAYVQIAGLVARRIICTLKPEQKVVAGERFGLIRFGSRADVYLPEGVSPQVLVGQYVIGGESILADLHATTVPGEGRAS
jgi:phosphatidylserine decarboxylase